MKTCETCSTWFSGTPVISSLILLIFYVVLLLFGSRSCRTDFQVTCSTTTVQWFTRLFKSREHIHAVQCRRIKFLSAATAIMRRITFLVLLQYCWCGSTVYNWINWKVLPSHENFQITALRFGNQPFLFPWEGTAGQMARLDQWKLKGALCLW